MQQSCADIGIPKQSWEREAKDDSAEDRKPALSCCIPPAELLSSGKRNPLVRAEF